MILPAQYAMKITELTVARLVNPPTFELTMDIAIGRPTEKRPIRLRPA